MRATRWPLLALSLAAAACGSSDAPLERRPGAPDADRDGVADLDDCAPDDPTAWSPQPLFVDADRDGRGIAPSALVCRGTLVPDGWAFESGDCDDADPAAFETYSGYADDDADRLGAGDWLVLCGGAAPPRVLAAVAGDCAPGDPARWQERPYLYRDADLDGLTVAREGLACSGDALDPGYSLDASGVDCDDADAARWLTMEAYADADGDASGAGPLLSLCTAGWLPPGYAAAGGDCAPEDPSAWASIAYTDVDGDGDGYTASSPGTLCVGAVVPPGYYAAPSAPDCNDADATAWALRGAYADVDGDGAGAGALVELCTGAGLPAGWVIGPSDDCAPEDGAAWRSFSYAYRDADGDGWTVAQAGTICIGTAPPPEYRTWGTREDCDDASAGVWAWVVGYADADHDGVGAPPGITSCTDGSLPVGQLASYDDCAPADGAAWRLLPYTAVDRDGDGHTAPVAGELCAGEALPDPYRATASGRDCDDGDPSVFRAIVRYADQDGDGVGATPRAIFCVATEEPAGWSRFGWDVDDAEPALDWDGGDEELLLLGLL